MSRPKRLAGISYIGLARYFLTFCTCQRRNAFLDVCAVERTLSQFRTTARLESFAILAYCLMPDHVHLLVEATSDTSDLRRFVKLAKQRSGAAHALKSSERLWQKGYYEHVLRGDEDTKVVARYILENPVRANLVADLRDYPHLGSDVWTVDQLLEGLTL